MNTGKNFELICASLKQLGIAALYALLIYVGELYFDSDIVIGYFEPASGLALAALLLGGKRYALGLLLGTTLVRAISEDSLWEAVIISLVDTLQALCGAWLLTRDGKFDSRLQSLRDYLRLILLGGCASIVIGTLAVNTTLLISGALPAGDYFHSLIQWWMSDTLGVILITPLILVLWSERNNCREAGKIAETVLLFGLTILAGQAIFLGWWHDAVGQVAQGYWMFLITTWVAVRLGIRETVVVLVMTAIYALLGAIQGVGFFANDITQSKLINYWFYMLTLSIVGMALATYFTERKQAELVLLESGRHLKQAQSVAKIGSWDYDLATGQLAWSDELYRIYGVSPETFTPNTEAFINLIHPDDRSAMQAWIEACASGQKPPALEFAVLWPNGTVRYIEGQGALMMDDNGAPNYIAGTAQDITERKKTEVDLHIVSTAFESHESMVITDADGVILRVNQAFTEATGYTVEEAVGQTPRLLKSGRHNADFYREMWETLKRTGKWQGEVWDRRKNGEIYPKLLSITAVKGDDGVVTHYVGAAHDITKRKAAEEEINNLAFYDSLTQLPNRRLLNDRLGKTMAASKRSGRHGAVMFLDLDNFKPLNDTHGHSVGDLLLVEVARRIAHCVREMDTVARFGGDEFVVVLSELDEDKAGSVSQAAIVAEKIRTTLADPYVLKIQPEGKAETTVEHHCTSSIGVVLFVNHEDSAEDILKWADMAMYQAKEAGRNQFRFYEPEV